MTTLELASRDSWSARNPKTRYDKMPSGVKGVKLHHTGGRVPTVTIGNHNECEKLVRSFQNQHMDVNGWIDLGYSFVVCEHLAMMGRGLGHLPAANGSGLNSGHYAILLLVGTSGITSPTDNMKRNTLALIDYIRKNGPCGKEIKGHRDGYSTDCPGPNIYAWIQAGCPSPDKAPTLKSPTQEATVNALPVLGLGDKGADVKTIRSCLWARGYFPQRVVSASDADVLRSWLNDTNFTSELVTLVRTFQRDKGLEADGIVGPKTWPYLLSPKPKG